MRLTGLKVLALAVGCGAVAAGPAQAARLVLGAGSGLWLTGDSTLHVYHSTATALRASGEMETARPFPEGVIRNFEFVVPVQGLKSGRNGLDENMWKSLKAKENPEILFKLSRLTAEPDADGGFRFQAAGSLTVAGRENAVTLTGRVRREAGVFGVEGEQRLRMTDFGIKPPSMMMGAIKTKDEVVIHYRVFLRVDDDQHEEAKP